MTRYSHCGPSQDRLFDGTYDHVSSMNNCDDCDPLRLVNRPARDSTDPKIHYGVIASGNTVIKDGSTRDKMAQELDVLCFEMEAAGLMDSFPCLVIRGICDYSDTHKNKQWQEYAAATAAAYAIELLSIIPANEAQGIPTIAIPVDDAERHNTLLESLKFDLIDARRSNIKSSHSTTCQWLLQHPDYLDWLDPEKAVDHNGFLWIRGKPGTGKSTIMNFAYKQVAKNKANTVISFFFNARGDDLERSTAGMYLSLLFQLLSALPRLLDVFDGPEHKVQLDGLHENIVSQSRQAEWPMALLRGLLRSAIARLGLQCLTFFVDALDECDTGQVEEMVEYFEDLGQYAVSSEIRFTVCFSSRHYPHIEIEHGRKLSLEHQEGHEKDIATYIQSKLKVGRSKTAEEIKTEMQAKAGGIFMWVVLVVDILNAEYRGGRIFHVRKRLDALPSELSDLFKEILGRDQRNPRDLQLCVQWILFAKRPLKLEEYYFAAVSGLSPDVLREWDPEEVTRDDMNRFVLSSSKGLAEATKSKNAAVQFIHESVREFFLKDGLQELWPNLTAAEFPGVSHGQLQQCCLAYIKLDISNHVPPDKPLPKAFSDAAKELRLMASEKFPFLEYATRHMLNHADAATDSQDAFLEEFPLQAWINLDNLFEKHEIRRYTQNASLLYILAENNLTRLMRTTLVHHPRINVRGERHQYPLFAALANNHRDAVKTLLQQETTLPQTDDVSMQLDYGRAFAASKGQTPLHWAFEKGHVALAHLLIAQGELNLDSGGCKKRTPLSWAAEIGHIAGVKLLLGTGLVNVNSRDNSGRTPLSWAIENGHVAIVKLLLDTGQVDIDSRDNSGQTPLSVAATNGHESIIRLLLGTGLVDADVDIDSKDNSGRTPLSVAAKNGHEPIIRLLLGTGLVDVDGM
ncbi:ankyrin repeats (3 copies) domain-containing protein [Hirsutella rhossiliensis]|uniref:Ankyrin repeats (3 copies) domain-containing protein n=1 Tax=Hirsutella rhossiliensis TaxID=111463 RepID=A0A9P8N7V4_9HYPO|nr:ankyrin repeats (3 copies) domain-containing protein [Hirsutella rhossiliensis]KAH0967571.1 ankyrin repeats (3 copies) domain-containing protein [Hirsutella rhossiliensis]